MKDKIIEESIRSLHSEGLRFSVDTLAEKLKISKKTIYKYFPNKEALALALYKKYYMEAESRAKKLSEEKGAAACSDLLYLYYDAKTMIRSEIFNKYKLNDVIASYAEEQNDMLWTTVCAAFGGKLSEEDRKTIRMIVDGTFEKLCDVHEKPDQVIERLVGLLC
ncbi:MAG: TetR/AcrR family transcriptional regulator [Lachnospiraceae bacterium]